ncbi:glycosyltransferase family 2 protein [Acetobacter tropicalis]|uniref:Glycosyltransferase involved in cell wall biogenesis n=2 Tax=Acetobacter tropicalis TaxID=104102 RepID=A0A094YVB5_9PROT|nr:glycosyltransferase [Acetobacter tropicalis]KGB24559.1 Glycosyltransferase involved in cell wall biogenesis [Acetobacter tropicalis]MDO8172297.1 glycosyltransferase [Acetobacter tropicalis]
MMFQEPSFSIIIANYNYEKYVGDAIESALMQDWPSKEIIVVDDGSTDRSVEIIKGFGNKVLSFFTKNKGQREANNFGFSMSSGKIIIFLDSDDMLLQGALRKIASVWQKGVSKVQVLVQRADARGHPVGAIMPRIKGGITPQEIRKQVGIFLDYPSPPGSGNAWSRDFLEKIFPLNDKFDSSTDTTCIAMAPYYGAIITIPQPLVLYRTHGENDSNLNKKKKNYSREVSRSLKRLYAIQDACLKTGYPVPKYDALFKNSHLLQLRIASLRLTPTLHPLSGDSLHRAFWDAFRIFCAPKKGEFLFGGMILIWSVLTILAPTLVAQQLIHFRFSKRILECSLLPD